ncbi:hypothetical protein LJC09_00475 [Desulfovibrio sp. OttesenSCG-928-F20]|nr:hypothetical protein [Desulfovibrio sp. OttesenSCG-928-F20]
MPPKGSIFFDAKDHELLVVVNRILERDYRVPEEGDRSFYHKALHPHGIKALSMSQEMRVAYAVVNLLDKLEEGQVQDRIAALQALHTEVLSTAGASFRYNTGRVLIQIMKNLIRAHGDTDRQLRLAHDFRRAATGRRRVVRAMLRRYYLLEMPEAWNQIAFDNHVHDANTKGRKSPTHLIMDAWIKGLRKLDVLYYNYVEPMAVAELLQAADIMGIKVRVGVEFQARFRDRFVQLTWQPRGFRDWRDMLEFFQEKPTQHLMRMGREASLYHHEYVMRLLDQYNERLRFELGLEYGVRLPEIPRKEIFSFVGIGQTSRTHLAELIYLHIRKSFAEKLDDLRERWKTGDPDEQRRIEEDTNKINNLTPDLINAEWLNKFRNPAVTLSTDPEEQDKLPEIMRILPMTLADWLTSIRSPCHITLNLCCLTVEDVLELLWGCEGMISHLEMYNLKNYEDGKMADLEAISELQTAINEGSAVALKRLIRNLILESDCLGSGRQSERCKLFMDILRNIPRLQGFYDRRPLGTRIGSDSTSRSSRTHGMGFAFIESLPARAREVLNDKFSQRKFVPFTQNLYFQVTYGLRSHQALGIPLTRALRKLPGMRHLGKQRKETWEADEKTARYDKNATAITTLGGFHRDSRFDFKLRPDVEANSNWPGAVYLNSTLTNSLKVGLGYFLTAATFLYTQQWWFLAWFGPIIWFAITGFRNVLQATLGGGGLRRSPLLTWNDYLSWTRLCDSLMYTGISVPLLELLVRNILLEDIMGMNSLSRPLLFYSIMSMINGFYIAGHNIIRGLPQEAVIGNLFRSVMAIPVSVFYNWAALQLFMLFDWPMIYLIESAAVLSKLASDTVAALIEGPADKAEYLRRRHWDYVNRFEQLFHCFARLEVLMPEEDVLDVLRQPKDFMKNAGGEVRELEKTIIVNALDMMYFWMYQPRARSTLKRRLAAMSREERVIFANAQMVLTRVHEISQMMVDGLVGIQFARALSFYLARYESYLEDISKLTGIQLIPGEAPGYRVA